MRTFTLMMAALTIGAATQAQTVATFEDLQLPQADTFYVNYSAPGTDVGFNDGLAHFPCDYDTSGGYQFWSYGFAYSNMTDSVTSGFGNQYSAKAGSGYNNSAEYIVAYGSDNMVYLSDSARGKDVKGFYVTNGTYAYNDMRDGSMFSKQFTNADSDWFKLTVYGYLNGQKKSDSVDFYLADFRFADSTNDYIVRDWKWVDLTPLGHVDSLEFVLTSSDNDPIYGMNTPAYFCMDNFTTNETSVGVSNTPVAGAVKVYPNPATNVLYVDCGNNDVEQIVVRDVTGKVMGTYTVTGERVEINTAALPAGMYLLQLSGNGKKASMRFVKQ